MKPGDLVQRSPEWFAARAGLITASRVGDMMATTKTGWAASRRNYFHELVAERLTGRPTIKIVRRLEARSEMEPEARTAYEFFSGNAVRELGLVLHPKIERAASSPDGFIGKDGQLEMKCLDPPRHIELLETGIINNGYLYQMQFGLACSKRKWCDFFTYCPTLPEELKTFTRRIERDDHLIKKIEAAVIEFDAEIEAKIAALRNGNRASNP